MSNIFCVGGTACLGKTTFVKSASCPGALTDYSQICSEYPVFKDKSKKTYLAALYDNFVASRQIVLGEHEDYRVFCDRYPWEGALYELIFNHKELHAELGAILPVLKKLHLNGRQDGVLLINSNVEHQLKMFNARGDFMDRKFGLEYVMNQNYVFKTVGAALDIPVYDLASYIGKHSGPLMHNGVIDHKHFDVVSRIWNHSFIEHARKFL